MRPEAGAKCKTMHEAEHTYDHAKKAVMKQACDSFKLAYQTKLQCRKDVRELWNSQYVSLGRYNTCAARLVAPASNEPYIQYRACKENKLNRYNIVSDMHDNARIVVYSKCVTAQSK